MRIISLIAFIFFMESSVLGQMADSCLLVGTYALNRVEMSQSLDSNSRTIPTLRWSLYEQSGLADTLRIGESFEFTRSVNFLNHFNQILEGQFSVKQDNKFTVFVSSGTLYTLPLLNIESLTQTELVIIEKFKTRWMRRTFKKDIPTKP